MPDPHLGYRTQPGPSVPSDWYPTVGRTTVTWAFQLAEDDVAPELVAPGQRCPTPTARTLWPAHHNPASPRGRIRMILADELGPDCHACHWAPGFAIDHDHATGLVRGLLCRDCNLRVDGCPHVRGCLWADYLNHPPAAHLELYYPRRYKKSSEGRQRRIDLLGFDPYPDHR